MASKLHKGFPGTECDDYFYGYNHDYLDDHAWVAVQDGPGLPFRGTSRPGRECSTREQWDMGSRETPMEAIHVHDLVDARALSMLDDILYEAGTESEAYFEAIENALRLKRFDAWAIVLFIMEVPVLGHLLIRRMNRLDFMAGPLREGAICGVDFPPLQGGETTIRITPPRLGCIVVGDKRRMARYGMADPVFAAVNGILAPLSPARRWLCVTMPPPPDWVAERSRNEFDLFMAAMA